MSTATATSVTSTITSMTMCHQRRDCDSGLIRCGSRPGILVSAHGSQAAPAHRRGARSPGSAASPPDGHLTVLGVELMRPASTVRAHGGTMRHLLLALLVASIPLTLVSAGEAKPAAPKLPPVVSPEIQADRSVTFRIRAAKAQSVEVRGQWAKDPLVLTKGEHDTWSV